MEKKIDNAQILKELQKRIPNYACPVCGGRKFSLENSIATVLTTDDLTTIEIGTYIPSAVVLCDRCGYMSFFALAKLGISLQPKGDSSNAKAE